MSNEAWTDRLGDFPPLKCDPEKCSECGDDMALRHICGDRVVIPRAAIVDAIQWRDWDAVRKWL